MAGRVLALVALLVTALGPGSTAQGAPPASAALGVPTLDSTEYGMNDGASFVMPPADVAALAKEPGVVLWRFHGTNWMKTGRTGVPITLDELSNDHGRRPVSELVAGWRADLDGDGMPEVLISAVGEAARGRTQYGATLLARRGPRWELLFHSQELPGETYQVEDLRDLDGDGRVDAILSARAGTADFYTSWAVLAFDARRELQRFVTRPPDSLHLMDLDKDGRFELVVRHLVSRRGLSHLWTFVDKVVSWDGQRFVEEPPRFVKYQDEVVKRRLIDELIDHYDGDPVVLAIKADVLRDLHAKVLAASGKQPTVDRQVERSRDLAKAGQREQAANVVARAIFQAPYDVGALRQGVSVALQRGRFVEALHMLYALVGIVPDDMLGWRQMGFCFAQLHERSAAIASFHNSVRMGQDFDARLAELRRATVREKSAPVKAAKVAAIAVLEGKPLPDPVSEPFGE